ncbi:hypothetical protein F4808DRAFT_458158 [Astrocystis sublimbata]|nr:hypothetical protein F4808DRAFT_458158 [Astrocystis sublimbata]
MFLHLISPSAFTLRHSLRISQLHSLAIDHSPVSLSLSLSDTSKRNQMAEYVATSEMVSGMWSDAALQVTPFVRTIKLSRTNHTFLGPGGQESFLQFASTLLSGEANFFADASNPERLYLGRPEDIERETQGIISVQPEFDLPVLQPGARDVNQHQHEQPVPVLPSQSGHG